MPQGVYSNAYVCVRDLARRQDYRFALSLGVQDIEQACQTLNVLSLKNTRFRGRIFATGGANWTLTAQLNAHITQACIITLQPVTTHIQESVTRVYSADWNKYTNGTDIEIPPDDTLEPLTDKIDIAAVFLESLALSLPLYPRAKGANFGSRVYTETGTVKAADRHPFAGLKAWHAKDSAKKSV